MMKKWTLIKRNDTCIFISICVLCLNLPLDWSCLHIWTKHNHLKITSCFERFMSGHVCHWKGGRITSNRIERYIPLGFDDPFDGIAISTKLMKDEEYIWRALEVDSDNDHHSTYHYFYLINPFILLYSFQKAFPVIISKYSNNTLISAWRRRKKFYLYH